MMIKMGKKMQAELKEAAMQVRNTIRRMMEKVLLGSFKKPEELQK